MRRPLLSTVLFLALAVGTSNEASAEVTHNFSFTTLFDWRVESLWRDGSLLACRAFRFGKDASFQLQVARLASGGEPLFGISARSDVVAAFPAQRRFSIKFGEKVLSGPDSAPQGIYQSAFDSYLGFYSKLDAGMADRFGANTEVILGFAERSEAVDLTGFRDAVDMTATCITAAAARGRSPPHLTVTDTNIGDLSEWRASEVGDCAVNASRIVRETRIVQGTEETAERTITYDLRRNGTAFELVAADSETLPYLADPTLTASLVVLPDFEPRLRDKPVVIDADRLTVSELSLDEFASLAGGHGSTNIELKLAGARSANTYGLFVPDPRSAVALLSGCAGN